MTHLFPLLTALLAASSAVASPGAGYRGRVHGKRRCAAGSSATASGSSLSAGSDSAHHSSVSSLSATSSVATASGVESSAPASPAGPGGNNVYVASGDPEVVGGPPVAAGNGSDNATVDSTASGSANGSSTNGPTNATATNATVPIPSGGSNANVTAAEPASAGRPVFAHYMVGLTSEFDQAAWEKEMTVAKSKSIDGFALNIGEDPYNDAQLTNAYAAAEKVGFKLFISVDFNWYGTDEAATVAAQLKNYISKPAQYIVDGKPLVSSFAGHDFNWKDCSAAVGTELYAVPNWLQDGGDNIQGAPGLGSGSPPEEIARQGGEEMAKRGAKGLFSWHVWPGQQSNTPVDEKLGTSDDEKYRTFVGNGTYMAGVSPWFFTHFGKEVPYSKNWLFKSETLWVDRWKDILALGNKVNMLEIVSWNDYGESHYVGPLDTPWTSDGSDLWVKGMPHDAMLDLAGPFIKAFKAGASEPAVDQEGIVYWYRPHLKNVNCDSTDNFGSKPTGWELVKDSVFVAAMTKSGGTLKVTSGGNAPVSLEAKGGVDVFEVPMGVGEQSFELTTTGGSASGKSNLTISDQCWESRLGKVYNYNFYSGVLNVGA
ncbi:hypothetical protein CcaverHIS002_0311630 [Cutaneotrichosporon cavernicola]|uniref:Glycoside hydrolase n=1 Tax=Cutaneotrichosporon cavernicola TaxID=279322 RepID=A0AA48QV69_9TREE|nr:uncharacterized protein CcaverHIS019_0311500 [Cutaneotrichosporon cavernicola]BEI83295.1 hypothetical protein CcaverHIS002_0311630 [Cutaneotrichosporon cavernicola]BEI91080.1 hypothetical protein CcaverHIS019_0311500 [Cutaneotrichosporon cavernicola]BEI98857.1 hypothetical protein CcaverHIS631_0311560 [Cutaneotrichosporon cavernicola]BEJ06630.1 hypothetical protein CcaverHIS641_0311520 [Cutaneotrichosporon cavernicola]